MTTTNAKPKGSFAAPPLYPHPLFEDPAEGKDEPPIVYKIFITRWDNGKQKWLPHEFAAGELTDLATIAQTFGGGMYELLAYGPGGATARRRITLDGRSKPLTLEVAAGDEDPGPVAAPPPFAPSPAPGGMDGTLLVALLNSNGENTRAMLSMMTSLTTAMLTRDRDSADRTLAMMQQANTAQMASVASILGAVMNGKGNGSSGILETLREGMAIGKEIATPAESSDSMDSLIEVAAPILAGMAARQAEQQQPPGGES